MSIFCYLFFFFQAEDGIRDRNVTGVQTCALPICRWARKREAARQTSRLGGSPRVREIALQASAGDYQRHQVRSAACTTTIADATARSEERRVGKECRTRWWADQ